MHFPLISILTELWHLLDVSAVAGHGAVLVALLFKFKLLTFLRWWWFQYCYFYEALWVVVARLPSCFVLFMVILLCLMGPVSHCD